MRGWSGNNSNTTPEDIIKNISVIRTSEDCPETKVKFLDTKNDKIEYVSLSFELTSEVYPSGKCCKALIPDQASNSTIGGLLVRIQLNDNLPSVEGFQVFMSDRKSSNKYHRKKFIVDGIELKANKKELGYILYNLKIYKEIYLVDNKKYACKNYQHIDGYDKVIMFQQYFRRHNIKHPFNSFILVSEVNIFGTNLIFTAVHAPLDDQ